MSTTTAQPTVTDWPTFLVLLGAGYCVSLQVGRMPSHCRNSCNRPPKTAALAWDKSPTRSEASRRYATIAKDGFGLTREIITSRLLASGKTVERRRTWPDEEKLRIK